MKRYMNFFLIIILCLSTAGTVSAMGIYQDKIVFENRTADVEFNVSMYDMGTGKITKLGSSGNSPGGAVIYGNYAAWIYWTSESIYLCNISSGKVSNVANGVEEMGPAGPALYGTNLTWIGNEKGKDYLYIYNIDSKKTKKVKTPNEPNAPSIWGYTIVWHDSSDSGISIQSYNTNTGKEAKIASSGTYPVINGNIVTWVGGANGDKIYYKNLSTGQQSNDPNSDVISGPPAIFGNNIVWIDWRNGEDVYLYNIETKKETQITSTPDLFKSNVCIWGDNVIWLQEETHTVETPYVLYSYDIKTKETRMLLDNIWITG